MPRTLAREAALEKIGGWFGEIFGARLQTLVVYGSGSDQRHHSRRSDLNLLAVLDRLDAATLELAAPAVRWWATQSSAPVIMLSRDEFEDDGDVFPIEYLDIQAHHTVLRGEDLFVQVPRFPEFHRRQVEHDLRAKLLRLRSAYMRCSHDARGLEELLLDSVTTFLTLFRHALVVVGEPLLWPQEQVLAAAAARFGFAAGAFEAILIARHQPVRLEGGKLEALRRLFAQYLAAIQSVEHVLEDFHASTSSNPAAH